jgi:predicted nucleic acid-binding protein
MVVDASIVLEVLLNSTAASTIVRRLSTQDSLHAPHLLDLEVAQALRRLVRNEQLSQTRSLQAVGDLADLRVTRYPHTPFLPRIWSLRHNLTAYDASYVALAESLDAVLLTRDPLLASSPGHGAQIELI